VLANLGRLARDKKDYRESEARLRQALAAFDRLGAIHDVLTVYDDIAALFLLQGDHARAEEMAVMQERQSRLQGYADLQIRALLTLGDCEAHSGRTDQARDDYAQALRLVEEQGVASSSRLMSLLTGKILALQEAPGAEDSRRGRENSQKKDSGEGQKKLPAPWQSRMIN
jgi:tetratricopeptide (TPR) repeat protein